ncbi:MAG: tRNA (adenosine(37)-N6)-dimethylallyltransferase MiaA [Alkalispirochaeta sp.]
MSAKRETKSFPRRSRRSSIRTSTSSSPNNTTDRPILLFGPTGCGKTDVLSLLARTGRDLSLEVISADSRQVYRGFDIGTAKPSEGERTIVPHHLIDICDGDEPYDIGRFVAACDELVPAISGRGGTAVLSGGTAFYLQGYLYGLPGTPHASPEVRRALEERILRDGLTALRRELAEVDPVTEARIAANDAYRVVRALEVYYTSRRPLSSYSVPTVVRDHLDPLIIGIFRERDELYRRINERVRRMFAAGLAEEVATLLSRGYGADSPAFAGIGYREFLEIGGTPPWSAQELDAIQERIARNTRRYAKRQETFFRKIPRVRWIHAEDAGGIATEVTRWVAAVRRG